MPLRATPKTQFRVSPTGTWGWLPTTLPSSAPTRLCRETKPSAAPPASPRPHPKGRQSLGFLKKPQRPFFLFFGCVVALMRSTLSRMSSTLGVSKDAFRVVVSNFWQSASARASASALPIFRRSASARALASALPIVSAIRLPFLEMGH